jgi:hypothetical protein
MRRVSKTLSILPLLAMALGAGSFSDGRQVFTNIGVHLKGMGSFRAIDDKPSFNLNMRISGDSPWRHLQHGFTIEEGAGDVELVCELRTYQGGGQAWFEADSLVVKRLP